MDARARRAALHAREWREFIQLRPRAKEMAGRIEDGVLGFDYPGYGHSTGTPSEQSCYAAAQAALDWIVREKKVAPEGLRWLGNRSGARWRSSWAAVNAAGWS